MEKETIVNQAVNEAYKNLTSIVDLNILVAGGYFGLIIPESKFKDLANYADEIVNKLFSKFCKEISKKITNDDIEFILYKSFCSNNPSDDLLRECFKLVNDNLTNKKSSNFTTLLESLTSLSQNLSEEETQKSLDTIFDILLDYYSIIRK